MRKLTNRQQAFCREYVKNGYCGTQAAITAGYSRRSARSIASDILTKPDIQQRIEHHKRHLEELLNINKSRVIAEHMKIGFCSIGDLHDTWVTRKDFEELSDDQRACIQEITTRTETRRTDSGEAITGEHVKVRLFDKQKALDSICKIMGYEAPAETNINLKSERAEIQSLFPFAAPKRQ